MEADQPTPPYVAGPNQPPRQDARKGLKKSLGPLAALGALLAKFKALLLPILKFLPLILKTGGSMFLSIWVYAIFLGFWYAFGIVLLLLVHECGHLIAARRLGLKVGAPVFIPFMGAFIALKEAPRNAWIEAQVGIGGPLLGTVGAVISYGLYRATGNLIFSALAYSGFLLNLFNLIPVGTLDGGRIVTALSPWLWLVGIVVTGLLMFVHFNFLILIIFIISLPRLFSLFRKKSGEEARYFEVTPNQRWVIGGMYFGLIAFLVLGMMIAEVKRYQLE
ncbi:MAG: site-2 protease family protein [Pedosphaera sp.]|nr:site-2 protease family protein [Pedosphaera sp.]